MKYIKYLNAETDDVATRLRALFRQDARQDPVRDRELKKLTDQLIKNISGDKALVKAVLAKDSLTYQMQGKPAIELTVEDGQAALRDASRIITEREDLKKYLVQCAAPTECNPASIDAIVAAVARSRKPEEVRAEIASAYRIAYTTYEDTVVAAAGLRKPRAAARASLFESANSSADPNLFKTQLEWLYLHPDHRSKSQLTKLVTKVISVAKGQPLFSIISSDDEFAREVLISHNFKTANVVLGTKHFTKDSKQLFLRRDK